MTGGTQTKSQLLARKGTECQDPILNSKERPLPLPPMPPHWSFFSADANSPRNNCPLLPLWGTLQLSGNGNNFFQEASSKGGAHLHTARGQDWRMLINNQRTSWQMRTSWRLKHSIHAAADSGSPYMLLKHWGITQKSCSISVLFCTKPCHPTWDIWY